MPPLSPDNCLFRRRRKDARPAELLEAALTLFVEKGFAATRSEEVAKAAGVSKGTLYLYFPSKEELLKAVIQHFLGAEIEAGTQEAAAADDGPTAQVLEQLLVAWWTRIYEGPASGVFKLVITEIRNFPEIGDFWVERVVRPGNQIVSSLLRRGIERGEFAAVDIDFAVHSMLMPMILLCVHKHSFAASGIAKELDLDPAAFMHAHFRLIFTGLQARPAESIPRAAA
ncbi:MAG: TetR/AcrR family transcriptional regulator [Burkholderiales bacterium]|nr:TetR/AcrR family transcriptional regulator [Burkholderiales bacterium]